MYYFFLSFFLLCYASLASATCGTDWASFIKNVARGRGTGLPAPVGDALF